MVAGNWKMHKTIAEAREFVERLLPQLSGGHGVEVGVCPPFLALKAVVEALRGSSVRVYAQNMYHAPGGAFTGEVSAPMLREVGVDGVVLGHSERRTHFAETDRELQLKVSAALEARLTPPLRGGHRI
jgi:triosephosphate isomerase